MPFQSWAEYLGAYPKSFDRKILQKLSPTPQNPHMLTEQYKASFQNKQQGLAEARMKKKRREREKHYCSIGLNSNTLFFKKVHESLRY